MCKALKEVLVPLVYQCYMSWQLHTAEFISKNSFLLIYKKKLHFLLSLPPLNNILVVRFLKNFTGNPI